MKSPVLTQGEVAAAEPLTEGDPLPPPHGDVAAAEPLTEGIRPLPRLRLDPSAPCGRYSPLRGSKKGEVPSRRRGGGGQSVAVITA